MSSFLYSSAAAKVVPEDELSSPLSSHVPITHSSKKAMDSSPSPDQPTLPVHEPSDDWIKPMLTTFDQNLRLNSSVITPPGNEHCSDDSIISPTAAGHTNGEDSDTHQRTIGGSGNSLQAPASPQRCGIWPKDTELNDLPFSPSSVKQMDGARPLSVSNEGSEDKDVIQEPAYLLKDRRPSPPSFESEETQAVREPAYQDIKPGINLPSSPTYRNPIKPAQAEVIGDSDYQRPSQALSEPKAHTASEAEAYDASWHIDEKILGGNMKESYLSSAGGKLPCVVEESESFSRREFGADHVLLYMSTHSSANHAANFSMHSSYSHYDFSSKFPSHHHSNRPNVSLFTHSSFPPNNTKCKSAPAGTESRTRSPFTMFRRGASEGGKLGERVVYQRPRLRRPRSLSNTLLWPLVKIKNGYVGCMMGLEGTGDLSGMAQGASYATRSRYFPDAPLSKVDFRNYG